MDPRLRASGIIVREYAFTFAAENKPRKSMLERFLKKTKFESFDDFMQHYEVCVPEHFNFAYDVVDAWAKKDADKRAMLWTNEEGEERPQNGLGGKCPHAGSFHPGCSSCPSPFPTTRPVCAPRPPLCCGSELPGGAGLAKGESKRQWPQPGPGVSAGAVRRDGGHRLSVFALRTSCHQPGHQGMSTPDPLGG